MIKGREKIIVNYINNKRKRQTFAFFLNAFNIKLNVKRRYNIHINPMVFNIKFIKVLYILFRSNNKINTFNLFVKIIERLKSSEH